MAELIGVGNALKLAQRFDGISLRTYGWKTWRRNWRDQCIRRVMIPAGIQGRIWLGSMAAGTADYLQMFE